MSKRFVSILTLCAMMATAAHAQYGGGQRGGGGGGRGGRGGRTQSPPSNPTASPAPAAPKPVGDIEIIGVIKAIDPANSRITIAYEPVEDLHWPAGTTPFVVSKTALFNGVTVGEKVRFKLDSQQISSLSPY